MISLFDRDGIVYAASDCTDFDDWARDLNLARSAWLEALVVKHLPSWVHRRGQSKKPHDQQAVASYMREHGFILCENKDALDYVVTMKGNVIGRFKVCLQSPEPNRCRLCGEPMTLASPLDHHKLCAVTENLRAIIKSRQSVTVPEISRN